VTTVPNFDNTPSFRRFPVAERATATAIAVEANVLGGVLSSVVGPLMLSPGTIAQFLQYNAIYVALTGINLIIVFCKYPLAPAGAPSLSAEFRHEHAPAKIGFWEFVRAHFRLLGNWSFLLVALTCGVVNGSSSSFGSTVSMTGTQFGIDSVAAGWIGFIQSLGGNCTGILACRLVDRYRNHKSIIVWTLLLTSVCILWFALMLQGWWPAAWLSGSTATWQVWVSCSIAVVAANTSWPVFFEVSAEEVFPIPEALSLTVLLNLYNLGSFVTLLIPIQQSPALFVSACFALTIVSAFALAGLFTPKQIRTTLDLSGKLVGVASVSQITADLHIIEDGSLAKHTVGHTRSLSLN
jgi:hypothetical protein